MTITVLHDLSVDDGNTISYFTIGETYSANYDAKFDKVFIDYSGDTTVIIPISPTILGLFFTLEGEVG